MSRKVCIAIGLIFVCLTIVGCGRSPASVTAEKAEEQLRNTANERLKAAVQVATVHKKYKEYDQAEKCLTGALADSAATDRAAAIALLDSVIAAKHAELRVTPEAPQPAPPTNPIADIPPEIIPPAATPPRGDQLPRNPNPKPGTKPADQTPVPSPSSPQPVAPEPKVVVFETEPEAKLLITKTAVTDEQFSDLELRARMVFEAKVALKLYEQFASFHTLTEVQQKKFNTSLAKWKGYAEKDLVRNGGTWVTVEAAKKSADQAEQLIAEAFEFLKKRSFKEAGEALVKSSRLDQNGIRADFILGMLNSGVGFNNPAVAEEHFKKVLARSPRHISALNNLAVIEIKQGKLAPALAHFTQATERAPRVREINQNLGRLIKEAKEKKLNAPIAILTKFVKLYEEESAAGIAEPSDPTIGWLYMPLYLPENEKNGRTDSDANGKLVLTGSGTGFVIHPGFVLTNRHVVSDAEFGLVDAIRVIDPADIKHSREIDAKVVAVSADLDLAIVQCLPLNGTPVFLSPNTPRRGTDVLALGYPKTVVIGRGIKATRGIVTGLPEPEDENMLMFDVELNGGNSGGPILDRTGAAIAIATVRYNSANVGNYSGGILAAAAIPFAKKIIHGFEQNATEGRVERSWPDIDAVVAPSTVMLHSYYRTVSVNVNSNDKTAGKGIRDMWEDVSCSLCSGTGGLRCVNPKCVAGVIQMRREYQVFVGEGELRRAVTRFELVKGECPVCSGKGRVDCKACVNGRDPSVGGR